MRGTTFPRNAFLNLQKPFAINNFVTDIYLGMGLTQMDGQLAHMLVCKWLTKPTNCLNSMYNFFSGLYT